MHYDDSKLSIPPMPANEKGNSQPVMLTILERLEKQNAWQNENISAIENKLHEFLNNRIPEKNEVMKDNSVSTSDASSASSAVLRQISVMENNCHKLEGIIKHLRQIV